MTVFDAANDPKKQFSQLQTLVSSKQYDAIIVQPIFGPQLIPLVKQAIRNGIKVVNVDQILGTNPTRRGLRSPACPATSCSSRRRSAASRARSSGCVQGEQPQPLQRRLPLLREGVLARHGDWNGFNSVIKGVPSIKVVAEGETFYQHAVALKAAQTMLQARSDINLIVGADQGALGAEQAAAGKELVLVGYGGGQVGLTKVKSGKWYGTVMQRRG